MIQDGGFYYVIGYGENINIPTIDMISREISFIGNLVGTYTDLQDLMTLTAQGKVTLHTSTYPLDAINDAMADLDAGRLQGRGILIPAELGGALLGDRRRRVPRDVLEPVGAPADRARRGPTRTRSGSCPGGTRGSGGCGSSRRRSGPSTSPSRLGHAASR